MDSGIQARRFAQKMGMKLLTAFKASPPSVDLANSVQTAAEAIMAMIDAPAVTQS
jgi:hypothetical protein